MKVTRFLEREKVIRFFGIALILAPFINISLHILVLKIQSQMAWKFFDFVGVLKTTSLVSYALAAGSVAIGITMLSGNKKAWKFVLLLIGSHLAVQILNIGSKAWQGPLAWPTFLLNAGLFFFIVDQLVWKVDSVPERPVVNLKSYRKILFSFGSTQPWGELKTLSSEELKVKSFAPVPANIENQKVEINFAKDVVIEIQFSKREGDMYYFKPLNMDKPQVERLNRWLQKIAV